MVSKSQTITDCSDIARFPELNIFVIRKIKPLGSKPVKHCFTGYLASSLARRPLVVKQSVGCRIVGKFNWLFSRFQQSLPTLDKRVANAIFH
jgi:hypothetical protein